MYTIIGGFLYKKTNLAPELIASNSPATATEKTQNFNTLDYVPQLIESYQNAIDYADTFEWGQSYDSATDQCSYDLYVPPSPSPNPSSTPTSSTILPTPTPSGSTPTPSLP